MANQRVTALVDINSLVNERRYFIMAGEHFTLPDGADWLETGRVKLHGQPTHHDVDLSVINGIGAKTQETLLSIGVATMENLIASDAAVVASALFGASAEQVKDWQQQAKRVVGG